MWEGSFRYSSHYCDNILKRNKLREAVFISGHGSWQRRHGIVTGGLATPVLGSGTMRQLAHNMVAAQEAETSG